MINLSSEGPKRGPKPVGPEKPVKPTTSPNKVNPATAKPNAPGLRSTTQSIGPAITNTGTKHFVKNQQGNIVRISSRGQYPARPNTPFQGAIVPSGNPRVNYNYHPGVAPKPGVGTIKTAGTSSTTLAPTQFPGKQARHRPQPVLQSDAHFMATHGAQKTLPSYKRKKLGRQG